MMRNLTKLEKDILRACAGEIVILPPYNPAYQETLDRLEAAGLIQSGYDDDQPTSWITDTGRAALISGVFEDIALAQKTDTRIEALEQELKQLRLACAKANEEICQTLGAALGYPMFCDDQKNFPGATEKDGCCVGDHVAETLAMEAAREIVKLRTEVARKERCL